MSKDDLVTFMKKKGNERKRALFEELQFQNKDYQHSVQFSGEFDEVIKEKINKLDAIKQSAADCEKLHESCIKNVEHVQQEKDEATKQHDKEEQDLDAVKDKLHDISLEINKNLLDAIIDRLK
jgi:translation initiation factor 2B subunit (eIF-2B alpha/beta/delta family)